ncbi:aspartate carbamoyltransferase [Kouleothrix aurantiaca]|uniref:Aspartate carbamoyltransferase n=1 Tax=Kouleothrix aurantiaca TaxID=186479 RepID=A0A0P9FJE3_9CHLR|nr:aspartate carbamoyltransferase [Kouleothrix aurantiaca]
MTQATLPTDAPATRAQSAPPTRRHVLDLDDFSRDEIVEILETTASMKEVLGRPIKQVPALRGKTVVNMFFEDSTRTRISFELAARALSANVVGMTGKGSSVEKGESMIDTVRTLQALGADILVIRHRESGTPYLVSQHFRGSVLNAGDGRHAHPTQALLDMFTIHERLGRLEGLNVVIAGDILHSRVARSNLWGLATMGAKVTLCAPPTLLGPTAYWTATWPNLAISHNLDDCVDGADVIMTLRLQKERQESGLLPSLREYSRLFGVNAARVARAAPHCLVMHPGPMNEGVEIMPDVATSAQSVIEAQVTNGVAVRMALLYRLAEA